MTPQYCCFFQVSQAIQVVGHWNFLEELIGLNEFHNPVFFQRFINTQQHYLDHLYYLEMQRWKKCKALKLCYIQRLISDFIYHHLSKMMQKEIKCSILYTFIHIVDKCSKQVWNLYHEIHLINIGWNRSRGQTLVY